MGVGRIVFNAIFWPLVIFVAFVAHAAFNIWSQSPQPIKIQDFPKGTSQDAKDAIIGTRKNIIKSVMNIYKGQLDPAELDKFTTEDFEFEDPWQKYEGREMTRTAYKAWSSTVKSVDISVHGEHHGAHSVCMDWTMNFYMNLFPSYGVPISFRTILLLEPSTDGKGVEKLFRIYEEWNGTYQLNEKTTNPIVGQIHQKLRRFVGIFLNATLFKLVK